MTRALSLFSVLTSVQMWMWYSSSVSMSGHHSWLDKLHNDISHWLPGKPQLLNISENRSTVSQRWLSVALWIWQIQPASVPFSTMFSYVLLNRLPASWLRLQRLYRLSRWHISSRLFVRRSHFAPDLVVTHTCLVGTSLDMIPLKTSVTSFGTVGCCTL